MPALPTSDDGTAAVRALDAAIDVAASDERKVPLLLERAWILGRVEDYQQADARSAALVAKQPENRHAWALRFDVLLRLHDATGARRLLPKLEAAVARDKQVELAHAEGDLDAALAGYRTRAELGPHAQSLTLYAVALAEAGRFDEAIALIPKAAATIRNNTPYYLTWLLFQWGRIYEMKGELAAARELFAEAHRRLPAHVDTLDHLIQAMNATGARDDARQLAQQAAAANPHPALRAHAGHPTPEVAAAWERYVTALPGTFWDHAARFYLEHANPHRAYELAQARAESRPSTRMLAIEAALQVGEHAFACRIAEPFVAGGTRAQRFLAWKALTACGREVDADSLARALGIATQ